MNHCVKLICVACLSAMIFSSCSIHKDGTGNFPAFEDLSAVQLSTNDESSDSSLVVDTAEYSSKDSHSSTIVEEYSSKENLNVEFLCANTEEYFNLPSPTVDTSKYKTVCEGDNPPLHGGNHPSDEGDNPPLWGGYQSSQIDNPPIVNTPIQQFSITDEEIEMLKYIVEQETRGGSYRHKCIVTNVVLNRVRDSRFPNTVKGVLFQKNQFSSTWNYYQKKNKPDEKTEKAVNDVLNGRVEDESSGSLYFHSMKSDGWFSSLSFVMEVEGHRFFK